MTNREQMAWAFGHSDYDALEIAKIVADMLDAVKIYVTCGAVDRLAKWLVLECDPETNAWGTLPSCGMCRWYDRYSGVCCNADSEHRADFMDGEESCDGWEKREDK